MSTYPSRLDQRLNWARATLHVGEQAQSPEVRARFFQTLQIAKFVPGEDVGRAFRTLRWESEGVVEVDDPLEFLKVEEDALQDEVDAFAAKMFSRAIPQRRQAWAELRRRAEFAPRIIARLDALAAGLDVPDATPDLGGSKHEQSLAQFARELFRLRPTARAARRHQILLDLHNGDVKPWRKAARALKARQPQLAALAPDLLEPLASLTTSRAAPATVVTQRADRRTSWALLVAGGVLAAFIVRTSLMTHNQNSSRSKLSNRQIQSAIERARKNVAPVTSPNTPWSPAAAPGGATANEEVRRILEKYRGPMPEAPGRYGRLGNTPGALGGEGPGAALVPDVVPTEMYPPGAIPPGVGPPGSLRSAPGGSVGPSPLFAPPPIAPSAPLPPYTPPGS